MNEVLEGMLKAVGGCFEREMLTSSSGKRKIKSSYSSYASFSS